MLSLKQQIATYLTQNPNAITLDIAQHFSQPEGEILRNLPDEFVRLLDGERSQEVLEKVSEWGELTTIIEKHGCIFEIKDRFPFGSNGYGYYNLNMKGDQGSLHGHLKLDKVRYIAFVSLPFRGKESYNIAFIAEDGETIFKIYLGRDEKRQLFPEQVEKFKTFQ